jgi:hypothetical protein
MQQIQKLETVESRVPSWMFWAQLSIQILIILFDGAIGIMTTQMLRESQLKQKWPFIMGVWAILASYVGVQAF